ncbi:MAG TPA: TolC family outer membrane protein, partial [Burkholderiales bacterium]|nr:TolC family outer membrane protein [Burkholderiales bacterium]
MRKTIQTLGFLVVAVSASPALAVDLMDIFGQAQGNDARYAAAKARYLGEQERLPQAKAGLRPNIDFEAGYNYNDIDVEYDAPTFNSGRRDYNAYNYGINLTQPLYRRQNMLAVDQATIQVAQASTELEIANQDLVIRTAESYFDVLLARFNLSTVRSQKIAVAEQLEQAKRNFVVGTATITDQREAQARYDLVVAQELGSVNDLRVATEALQVLTGKPVRDELAGLRGGVSLTAPSPADIEAWVEQSYVSSLQVLRAQQTLEIAQTEVNRQRAGHQPTLDLIGTLSRNDQESSAFGVGSDTQSALVGLQFNLPIYQGGAISSRTREAIAGQERAAQELEDARRQVAQATRESYLGV